MHMAWKITEILGSRHHQLRRRRSGLSSTSSFITFCMFSGPLLADECGMAGQVRLRNQQVESLETRVKLLDEEISSKDEIIKVLREVLTLGRLGQSVDLLQLKNLILKPFTGDRELSRSQRIVFE